jgi:hypothetical protein
LPEFSDFGGSLLEHFLVVFELFLGEIVFSPVIDIVITVAVAIHVNSVELLLDRLTGMHGRLYELIIEALFEFVEEAVRTVETDACGRSF